MHSLRIFLVLSFVSLVQCISASDRNALLNLHNSGRSCAKVAALQWDTALETVAQNYANGCSFSHNAARSTQYKSISGKDTYVGENIAWGGPVSFYGPDKLFNSWWEEQSDYACGTPIGGSNFGAVGHYTQIMWDDTTLLGCGVAVCNNQNYLVCNYAQGGNYMNQLPYPVANCPSPACKPSAAGGSVTSEAPPTTATSAPPTSEDVPTKTPTTQAVTKTSTPIITTAEPTAEPTVDIDLQVLVTVTLQVAPGIVSVNRFANEITGVLGIPQAAIENIQVDIDQSTSSTTVVHFTLINAKVTDAKGVTTTVDPIAAAEKLKQLAASQDPSLQTTTLLANMQVNSVVEPEQESSPGFVQTSTFIIIVAVVGGVVLISAAVAVTIVVLKKKGRVNWF